MTAFIRENLSTIVLSAILTLIVILIIIKMIRDRKNGKSGCSFGCENCDGNKYCRKK